MTQRLKNVLITGAYGGLGRSLAYVYLSTGHNVLLLGKDQDKLNNLKDHLGDRGDGLIETYACDLENTDSILSTMGEIKRDYEVDILINCAAIFPVQSMTNMSLEEYRRCMKINIEAPFLLIKEFSKDMIKNKWGRIINIASSSAYGGAPFTSAYCASKHALLGLSRSLYKELKPDGVRVFCISPGSIQTEMGKEVEKLGQLYDTFMTPEEVAEYVWFATSYNGQMISEEIRLNRMFVQ